jgi:hypothetical protein
VNGTCPTCERSLPPKSRRYIYDWGEKTAVYCEVCDTPARRKNDAPLLEANDFDTRRIVTRRWKDEDWRVYLEAGDTPGCITFPITVLTKACDGNTTPLEWRLEEEFNRRVDLEGAGEELANEWLSGPVEEYWTTNGTVSGGSCE